MQAHARCCKLATQHGCHAGKGKVLAYAGVPDARVKTLNAGEWVKAVLAVLGGKGGGKPGNAQGQGPAIDKVSDAQQAAEKFAKQRL